MSRSRARRARRAWLRAGIRKHGAVSKFMQVGHNDSAPWRGELTDRLDVRHDVSDDDVRELQKWEDLLRLELEEASRGKALAEAKRKSTQPRDGGGWRRLTRAQRCLDQSSERLHREAPSVRLAHSTGAGRSGPRGWQAFSAGGCHSACTRASAAQRKVGAGWRAW
eukprot:scaffold9953_cov32-Tisochrysis_lutea.AAC.1